MPQRQPALPKIWPKVWLVSDARNDAQLETILLALPRGSGLIYRHYHLGPADRRARFEQLARITRRRGHRLVLAGSASDARAWRADGAYGSPAALARGPATLRLVTTHSLREIARARRARADAILLSPVFATRSHPDARTLGPLRFRLLAARAAVPVVALGGIRTLNSGRTGCQAWAAIDGLIPKDS